MYKALGIILIVISIGFFTYLKIDVRKKEIFNIEEMLKALTFIKQELSFSLPEISVLCKRTAEFTDGEVSELFNEISAELNEDTASDFYSVWRRKANLLISDTDDFAKCFGKKNLNTEIENIENTLSRLSTTLAEKKESYINDKKLILSLGAAIGAVIIILAI